jgi:hypothetical protein
VSYWDGSQWVADTSPPPKHPSRVKRLAAATLEAALITSLTFGLIAGSAFAGKGGGGGKPGGGGHTSGGGTVALVLLESTDGLAHFRQHVTFTVSTSAAEPYVNLNCYQGTTWVSGEWGGFFVGSAMGSTFTLGPTGLWLGGAADCTANLNVYGSKGWVTIGSTSFHVYE